MIDRLSSGVVVYVSRGLLNKIQNSVPCLPPRCTFRISHPVIPSELGSNFVEQASRLIYTTTIDECIPVHNNNNMYMDYSTW